MKNITANFRFPIAIVLNCFHLYHLSEAVNFYLEVHAAMKYIGICLKTERFRSISYSISQSVYAPNRSARIPNRELNVKHQILLDSLDTHYLFLIGSLAPHHEREDDRFADPLLISWCYPTSTVTL